MSSRSSGLMGYLAKPSGRHERSCSVVSGCRRRGRPLGTVGRTYAGATTRRSAVVEGAPGSRPWRRGRRSGWERSTRLRCSATGARCVATRFATSLESMWRSTPRGARSERTNRIWSSACARCASTRVAITKCEVDVDGVHVMTTELRAAYEQMDAVWKCLPDEVSVRRGR